MYLCVYNHVCLCLWRQRGHQILWRDEVTGSCEPSDVSAGCQIPFLCKSGRCSEPLNHLLQPQLCPFLPLSSLSVACVFLIIRNFQHLLIRLWIFWVSFSWHVYGFFFSFHFRWICFVLKHSNYWSLVNLRHNDVVMLLLCLSVLLNSVPLRTEVLY